MYARNGAKSRETWDLFEAWCLESIQLCPGVGTNVKMKIRHFEYINKVL